MKQQLIILFIALPIYCYPTLGLAETTAAKLVSKVEDFLMAKITDAYPQALDITVDVREPDSRLNFDKCKDPTLNIHGSQEVRQRMLIRATCSASFALHLSAKVEVLKDVVVVTQPVGRQQVLTTSQLDFGTVNILANQRQFLTQLDQAAGLTLVRSVRSGTALTVGMVKPPDLVTRGDSVVIVAQRGDLIVKMPGIAMMTGSLDQQINVKNQSSDKVVKGWVKAPGEVHVPF